MMTIHVLDDITANQIAAGEVVERPASVVKELVENALDALATKIDVIIFDGGVGYIRVVDNGIGMTKEDAKQSLFRHATSKLVKANDLLQLTTLGFRGEALPSIASVSKFSLITRIKSNDMATIVHTEGEGKIEVSETGGNVGTTVIVENLFFNVPARKKFLKTNSTEGRYISEILIKMALGRPDVAFSLVNGDRNVLSTSGDGNLLNTITSLYGKETSSSLMQVDFEYQGVKLYGFMSRPTFFKNSRQWQMIYVNGRCIGSKMISKAIDHAYQSMLPKNRFSFLVLNIRLDSTFVDVNVHPQKAEVKFCDEGLVYRAVYHGLLKVLTKPEAAVAATTETEKFSDFTSEVENLEQFEQQKLYDDLAPSTVGKADNVLKNSMENVNTVRCIVPEVYSSEKSSQIPFGEVATKMKAEENKFRISDSVTVYETETDHFQTKLWPIGQVDKTFVVAQSEKSLFLIDQHAAHERILYDRLVRRFEKVDMQTLIVPIFCDLSADKIEIFEKNKNKLLELGIDVECAGDTLLRVNALPVDVTASEIDGFVQELGNVLTDSNCIKPGELRANILHIVACKAAIKAGEELNMKQMRDLILQLCNTDHPFTCPHGRPCMIEITTDELYKKFKRTGF